MKNFSAPPRVGGRSAVTQLKGPGMNLGLKKPRKGYIPKPKPFKEPQALKNAESGGNTSSYLPNTGADGSVQAMGSGKGKSLATKLLRSQSW